MDAGDVGQQCPLAGRQTVSILEEPHWPQRLVLLGILGWQGQGRSKLCWHKPKDCLFWGGNSNFLHSEEAKGQDLGHIREGTPEVVHGNRDIMNIPN